MLPGTQSLIIHSSPVRDAEFIRSERGGHGLSHLPVTSEMSGGSDIASYQTACCLNMRARVRDTLRSQPKRALGSIKDARNRCLPQHIANHLRKNLLEVKQNEKCEQPIIVLANFAKFVFIFSHISRTPLTGLIVLSVLGLASAGVYEQPEEPRFQSEDARSYMEQDSQGFMQQDPEGYVQQDNRAVYEEDNDVAEVEVHYQNSWDGKLHYECSSKDAIFRFQSIHDNRKEDRLWRFDCKKVHRLFLVLCAVNLKEIPRRLSLMVNLTATGIMESTNGIVQ